MKKVFGARRMAAIAVAVGLTGLLTGCTKFVFFDPSTFTGGSSYVTYGTTTDVSGAENCPNRRRYVPYFSLAPSTGDPHPDQPACYEGDAMEGGPHRWLVDDRNPVVWAPDVEINPYDGRYNMFFTGTVADTWTQARPQGQKCIFRAQSTGGARGQFTVDPRRIICPGGGRWAIDPDVVSHNGRWWIVFRDDGAVAGTRTAISAYELDRSGNPMGNKGVLMTSDTPLWVRPGRDGVETVENPAMFRISPGGVTNWILFYSGNQFDTKEYATGLMHCNSPTGPCSVIGPRDRPFFGHSSTTPFHEVPNDTPGPGGMTPFREFVPGQGATGLIHVAYQVFVGGEGETRRTAMAALEYRNGDFLLRPCWHC
jgi:hypothetical protein